MVEESESQVSLPLANDNVTLQIGDRRFTTTKMTLVGSGFLSALVSGRWNNAREDGSYFIDADEKLFEHILRYLRRGVLPIFYDPVKGHDYALYLAILEEAKFFQIDRLRNWLEKKEYVKAATVTHDIKEVIGTNNRLSESTGSSGIHVEYHTSWGTKKVNKVYICPRGIPVHKGKPERSMWTGLSKGT